MFRQVQPPRNPFLKANPFQLKEKFYSQKHSNAEGDPLVRVSIHERVNGKVNLGEDSDQNLEFGKEGISKPLRKRSRIENPFFRKHLLPINNTDLESSYQTKYSSYISYASILDKYIPPKAAEFHESVSYSSKESQIRNLYEKQSCKSPISSRYNQPDNNEELFRRSQLMIKLRSSNYLQQQDVPETDQKVEERDASLKVGACLKRDQSIKREGSDSRSPSLSRKPLAPLKDSECCQIKERDQQAPKELTVRNRKYYLKDIEGGE